MYDLVVNASVSYKTRACLKFAGASNVFTK